MSFVPVGWQATSSELAGKTILVTGANRGIGEAVALSCARHGAEVLLLGRDEASLTRVYDQIVDLGCPTPGIIPLISPPATLLSTTRWQMNSRGQRGARRAGAQCQRAR